MSMRNSAPKNKITINKKNIQTFQNMFPFILYITVFEKNNVHYIIISDVYLQRDSFILQYKSAQINRRFECILIILTHAYTKQSIYIEEKKRSERCSNRDVVKACLQEFSPMRVLALGVVPTVWRLRSVGVVPTVQW